MSTDPQTLARNGEALTQAERTALSDTAMIEAAMELILENGTEKTTLAAIGEKAGYSRGLATYRFGSKAGLFDEICKSIARQWLDYLKAGVGDKFGVDAMCAALDAYFRFVSDRTQEARVLQILYSAAASPTSGYQETSINSHQRQRDDVARWIRSGIDAGIVRQDVNPEIVAVQYIAYISGITYLWLIDPASVDFRLANEDMKTHLKLSLTA